MKHYRGNLLTLYKYPTFDEWASVWFPIFDQSKKDGKALLVIEVDAKDFDQKANQIEKILSK